ncbi:MAG: Gx transporter family protein [Gemmatimonadota bacterium]|nr:Gx transporter family protein [Gemmatimonadota bacterium]MDP6801781.1 Gx transporter family protein [Gemmatimonadota bacterium]MDP7031143.1 Gx transporter family protein [Gemmatimonadota bacterium]
MTPRIPARTVARLALLVVAAATLQIAESLFPRPVPWFRLGLANAVTLLALSRLGFASAAAVALVRTTLAGLLLGTLGGPSFLLSLAGALAALVVMAASLRFASPPLSLLGVSAAGAAAHGCAQLAVLVLLLDPGAGALFLLPMLVGPAVPLGLVTGGLVSSLHRRLPAW